MEIRKYGARSPMTVAQIRWQTGKGKNNEDEARGGDGKREKRESDDAGEIRAIELLGCFASGQPRYDSAGWQVPTLGARAMTRTHQEAQQDIHDLQPLAIRWDLD